MAASIRRPRVGPKRLLRDAGKHSLRAGFELGQRLGINVLPNHFYSSVPDLRSLNESSSWRQPHSMLGISGAHDLDAQLKTVERWITAGWSEPIWQTACREHGEAGYGAIESDVLYGFIRSEQPERIVQVGAGVSTAVILQAAREGGFQPQITCVDPFPTSYLIDLSAREQIRLIAEPAQEIDISELHVDDGDLLFIDSTHTVKPGSEVNRLVFEALPRLSTGAWVHFHDITFPYDYSRSVLSEDLFFWNESTLILAFLTGNDRYSVSASMSMLHYGRPNELREFLPHYQPQAGRDGVRTEHDGHFPSSLYLRASAD